MSGWTGFLALAPERVREVIESGPMTYGEYGSGKLSVRDKQMGLMRFKGGTGRGAIPMKSGQRAVVYQEQSLMGVPANPTLEIV